MNVINTERRTVDLNLRIGIWISGRRGLLNLGKGKLVEFSISGREDCWIWARVSWSDFGKRKIVRFWVGRISGRKGLLDFAKISFYY